MKHTDTFMIAHMSKVSGISSGTEIRNLLGSPKFDENKRQQIFKKHLDTLINQHMK